MYQTAEQLVQARGSPPLPRLLQILFGQDHRFHTMRTEGIPPTVQAALAKFWSDLGYRALAAQADLTPHDRQSLVAAPAGNRAHR